jgi:hypothetical protein
MLDHMKESPYSEGRLEDWDIKSLRALEKRVQAEIEKRGLRQIAALEEEANEIRAALGLKQRKPLKAERPLKS